MTRAFTDHRTPLPLGIWQPWPQNADVIDLLNFLLLPNSGDARATIRLIGNGGPITGYAISLDRMTVYLYA